MTENSYHVTLRNEAAIGSFPGLIFTLQGDFSLKPQLGVWVSDEPQLGAWVSDQLRAKDERSTKTVRVRHIIVGNQEAEKHGKQPWHCFPAHKITPVVTLLKGLRKTKRPQNLGSERIGTIPVWHVRQVWSYPFRGKEVPAPVDYFISQRNFTAVRVTVFAALPSNGYTTHLTTSETFTKYGEHVRATLPAVCRPRFTNLGLTRMRGFETWHLMGFSRIEKG